MPIEGYRKYIKAADCLFLPHIKLGIMNLKIDLIFLIKPFFSVWPKVINMN